MSFVIEALCRSSSDWSEAKEAALDCVFDEVTGQARSAPFVAYVEGCQAEETAESDASEHLSTVRGVRWSYFALSNRPHPGAFRVLGQLGVARYRDG